MAHDNNPARSLETPQSAQAGRQGIHTSVAREKIGGEGAGATGRRPIPISWTTCTWQRRRRRRNQPRSEPRSEQDASARPIRNRRRKLRGSGHANLGKRARSLGRPCALRWTPGVCEEGRRSQARVTRKQSEMTPQDMRRKGSWAVRFCGRKKLPPLVDRRGGSTQHAQRSAHAWVARPVPKTAAAAGRCRRRAEQRAVAPARLP